MFKRTRRALCSVLLLFPRCVMHHRSNMGETVWLVVARTLSEQNPTGRTEPSLQLNRQVQIPSFNSTTRQCSLSKTPEETARAQAKP
jgi:hypothetical protein